MAGSLNHLVDECYGTFKMDSIENMGDAREALEECFNIIYALSEEGDADIINKVCEKLHYPKVKRDLAI